MTEKQVQVAVDTLLARAPTDPQIDRFLLNILIKDIDATTEEAVMQYSINKLMISPLDLSFIEINDEIKAKMVLAPCRSTWTVPFDEHGDIHMLATAAYLSPAVQRYWQATLGGHLIWHVASMIGISNTLDAIAETRAQAAKESALSNSLMAAVAQKTEVPSNAGLKESS